MRPILIILMAASALWGCKSRDADSNAPFRLGLFPNVTHAQALVGNHEGLFKKALGATPLEVKLFNAGPAAMEALLAGAIDATYVGGGPAVVAFVRSEKGIRVIAGSASGGSSLVCRTAQSAGELVGKRIATPQIGNSQDIAFRTWLRKHGLKGKDYGGTVEVFPQPNPEIFNLFREGYIEGAWVPEPWASRLLDAGGHVIADERELSSSGRSATTVLVATAHAMKNRRPQLLALLRVHLELTQAAQQAPLSFAERTNAAFKAVTGKGLAAPLLKGAFSRMDFLADPHPEELAEMARRAVALGYLPPSEVDGIVDSTLLDEVLAERPQVPSHP